MRTALPLFLVVALTLTAGCETSPDATSARKAFNRLYQRYSERVHEQLLPKAESMSPAEITAEAARIWDEVIGPHRDVLDACVREILMDLDTAEPLDESRFEQVASYRRPETTAPAEEEVAKQLRWHPVQVAQTGLTNWLARHLSPRAFAVRQLLAANAALFWTAVDRDIRHPKLMLRQGPMIFLVELSRPDGYYRVESIRWLRPKGSGEGTGPGPTPGEPASGKVPASSGGETAPAETAAPASGGPAPQGAAAPAPKPASSAPEKAAPTGTPSAPAAGKTEGATPPKPAG